MKRRQETVEALRGWESTRKTYSKVFTFQRFIQGRTARTLDRSASTIDVLKVAQFVI